MTTTRASSALVIAAAVCFGTTGTAQALGGEGATPLSIGAARIVFGGVLLALVAAAVLLLDRRKNSASTAPLTALSPPSADRAFARGSVVVPLTLVAVGAIGVATYQPAFFTGTSQNGVAVGTLVALGSAPVLTGLLEWVVRRKAPGVRWAIATTVAAIGVVVLSGVFAALFGDGGASGIATASATITPLGMLGSLAAGASYAVYAISSKTLLDRGWSPTATMGATFGVAAVLMTPVLLGSDLSWLATPAGVATTGWLAIVTIALAYTLFARGLRALPASKTATLTLVEPLTATVLGVFVLREQFSASTVIGLLLLVAGLTILTVGGRRERSTNITDR